MSLQIGELIRDRYRILQQIGQGGMGAVYLAEDERLTGRQCALKEVFFSAHSSPEELAQAHEQFYQEASFLARLDHPNLPKVSDYFSSETSAILVMDYVAGDDLKVLLDNATNAKKLLSPTTVMQWAKQILDALEHLHGQTPPIVHRDIKPSNLKLTPSGMIKLVDFGLAKLLVSEERTVTVVQGRGTVHYTPLEQYGGDTGHTDQRTDIYALAATLYHLLSGKPPAEAKARFLNQGELIPLRKHNPKVSARAARAIHWGLALHPIDRPQTIAELRKALFRGIFPDADGEQSIFVPETGLEWFQKAFSDPVQRVLAFLSVALMLLGMITTIFSIYNG